MSTHLESMFRNLRRSSYRITSRQTSLYNCISWAATEDHRLWWPIGAYWPQGVPREENVESFINAFRTLGYEVCNDHTYEAKYEKVAIYVDSSGTPTHMARQLKNGRWTSKLGSLEDIEHNTLQGLEGGGLAYGKVIQVMKRKAHKPRQPHLLAVLAQVFRWVFSFIKSIASS